MYTHTRGRCMRMRCKRRLPASEEHKSERARERSPSPDTRLRDRLPTFPSNSQHTYSSLFPSGREILPDRSAGSEGEGCDGVGGEAPALP